MAEPDDVPLSHAFWEVARLLRHASREALAAWDISPSHARALGVLERSGAMRLGDLSERLHIAPRSVTEVVDTLEERGLVQRQPDPADRRATLVAATAEGSRVAASIEASRAAQGDLVFGSLSVADREQLASILRRLREPGPGG